MILRLFLLNLAPVYITQPFPLTSVPLSVCCQNVVLYGSPLFWHHHLQTFPGWISLFYSLSLPPKAFCLSSLSPYTCMLRRTKILIHTHTLSFILSNGLGSFKTQQCTLSPGSLCFSIMPHVWGKDLECRNKVGCESEGKTFLFQKNLPHRQHWFTIIWNKRATFQNQLFDFFYCSRFFCALILIFLIFSELFCDRSSGQISDLSCRLLFMLMVLYYALLQFQVIVLM